VLDLGLYPPRASGAGCDPTPLPRSSVKQYLRALAVLGVLAVGALAACGAPPAESADAQTRASSGFSPEPSAEPADPHQANGAAEEREEASAQEAQPAPSLTPPSVDGSGDGTLTLPAGRFGWSAAEALACQERRTAELGMAAEDPTPARHPGESAANALRHGWYPAVPDLRAGSILPCGRVVAYYGNPNSTRMGVLARYPKEEMIGKLRDQVREWEVADPAPPVIPALHMVAVVASDQPGPSGHYRTIMRDRDVEKVLQWAREVGGVLFVDMQVGTDDIRSILPRFEWVLREPDVHLGIDPEFMMKDGSRPGRRVGTMSAADINYVSDWLELLVREHDLPPKIFVVHRFTQRMVTGYRNIRLRPEVQIVMHMDGWGEARDKLDTWNHFVVREPVQYAGFKVFYQHDARQGNAVMSPRDLIRLHPAPLYIQYQ
jgi:hypothetical protein